MAWLRVARSALRPMNELIGAGRLPAAEAPAFNGGNVAGSSE